MRCRQRHEDGETAGSTASHGAVGRLRHHPAERQSRPRRRDGDHARRNQPYRHGAIQRRKGKPGKVIRQNPKPGKVLAPGAKVKLTVGK